RGKQTQKVFFFLVKKMSSAYRPLLEVLIVMSSQQFTDGFIETFKTVEYLVAQRCKNAGVGNIHRPFYMSLILGFITSGRHHSGAVMIGKIQERTIDLSFILISFGHCTF